MDNLAPTGIMLIKKEEDNVPVTVFKNCQCRSTSYTLPVLVSVLFYINLCLVSIQIQVFRKVWFDKHSHVQLHQYRNSELQKSTWTILPPDHTDYTKKQKQKTRKKYGGCISVKICHFKFASYTLPMNVSVSFLSRYVYTQILFGFCTDPCFDADRV